MRNIRGQAKTEAEYYRSNPLQHCQICGRLFVKRQETVCSRECAARLEEQRAKKR
jgi:predicted nucleic acid-binding Zn ribbon protein